MHSCGDLQCIAVVSVDGGGHGHGDMPETTIRGLICLLRCHIFFALLLPCRTACQQHSGHQAVRQR
jgi:hypothetical protein